MLNAFKIALATLGVIAISAGCALQPITADGPPLAERTRVDAFEFEGRIAASDGSRAASGRLLWLHGEDRDDWTFFTPLGQVVAQVVGTPQGATMLTASGERLDAPDVSTLLPELLGVAAPADHLAEWIQAIPASGATVLQIDPAGRPLRISDSGWIIDYPEYADDSPASLPRRVDAHWGETRLRILVDTWTPLP